MGIPMGNWIFGGFWEGWFVENAQVSGGGGGGSKNSEQVSG